MSIDFMDTHFSEISFIYHLMLEKHCPIQYVIFVFHSDLNFNPNSTTQLLKLKVTTQLLKLKAIFLISFLKRKMIIAVNYEEKSIIL